MNLQPILTAESAAQLRQLTDEAQHIVLFCHLNADGDAIGSMAAATLLLRRLGKSVTAIAPNNFPDFLLWIPTAREVVQADRMAKRVDEALAEADLVLLLDFNTLSRMGSQLETKVQACKAPMVMIDHHIDPVAPCRLIISHPEMCSTCEVLLRVMLDMGWADALTADEATALYTGMMTDTGNFAYGSNRPEVFLAVSILLTTGIDKDRIYRNIFYTYSEARMRMMGYLLYVKMSMLAHGAALITMTNDERKHFHVKNGATEGIVNLPLQIEGMQLSIFLREDTEQPGLIRVSTRSVDDFPCNELCAEFFNGGGHKNASGGSLQMSMDEAIQMVQKAVKKYEDKLKK